MSGNVTLVRHTQVALYWKGRCYGTSDAGLSRAGLRAANALARKLAAQPIDLVIHSGLLRARYLAERIALLADVPTMEDPRWMERDFGAWEGRTWNAIWRESGSEMDRMLSRPRVYRPGGGETTHEMARRAIAAWKSLPGKCRVVVITHGGPIAAICAHLADAPLPDMMKHRPREGAVIRRSPNA